MCLGFGVFFSVVTMGIVHLEKAYTGTKITSEFFNTAGRDVKVCVCVNVTNRAMAVEHHLKLYDGQPAHPPPLGICSALMCSALLFVAVLAQVGLTAAVIVSQWTWAATLLQSSNVAWQYGVSGPFWYASGASIQILLFGILAIQIKRCVFFCDLRVVIRLDD